MLSSEITYLLKPGTSQDEPKPAEASQNNPKELRNDPKFQNWGNIDFFTSKFGHFGPKSINFLISTKFRM